MSLAMKRARAFPARGRAPQGDPGIFGGIVGAIKGGVTSLVTGGNPIAGAIKGGVEGFRDEPEQQPQRRSMPRRSPPRGVQVNPPFGGLPGIGARIRPGSGPGFDFGVGQRTTRTAPAPTAAPNGTIGCPSGFRPNKSDYFLRDGTFVPKGTRCVKIRRRNSLNPRALDRAISRVTSAKKASNKLSRIRIHKKC